jgi:hypothetical protein
MTSKNFLNDREHSVTLEDDASLVTKWQGSGATNILLEDLFDGMKPSLDTVMTVNRSSPVRLISNKVKGKEVDVKPWRFVGKGFFSLLLVLAVFVLQVPRDTWAASTVTNLEILNKIEKLDSKIEKLDSKIDGQIAEVKTQIADLKSNWFVPLGASVGSAVVTVFISGYFSFQSNKSMEKLDGKIKDEVNTYVQGTTKTIQVKLLEAKKDLTAAFGIVATLIALIAMAVYSKHSE